MEYCIVPMTRIHTGQIADIERLCFPDPWSRQLLEELVDHAGAVSLAAVGEDGTVLGYASAQTVLDEGYINNVAVHPACRRQGIASRLLEELRRQGEALELAFLTLEVRASNAPAIALYEKHGFAAVGRRKNYYDAPKEDAILMTLEFENGTESDDAGRVGGSI